jgi:hypothetical protein
MAAAASRPLPITTTARLHDSSSISNDGACCTSGKRRQTQPSFATC